MEAEVTKAIAIPTSSKVGSSKQSILATLRLSVSMGKAIALTLPHACAQHASTQCVNLLHKPASHRHEIPQISIPILIAIQESIQ